MTEADLIVGCQRGERAAQRELYERTAPRVYRLLLRMTRSADRAADLAQQTYVRALTRFAQFDGRASVTTWLCRIAINEALQAARRERAARTHHARYARLGPRAPASAEVVRARLDLDEALASLSTLDRAMLLLRYQEGLDYAAIAEVTGCPAGTVASRLNRARQRLRARLDGPTAREENPRDEHRRD